MAKEGFMNDNSLSKFIDEVNRCGSGQYEVGVDEDIEQFDALRATILFNKARWEYLGDGFSRVLVLYCDGNKVGSDRIRITNPQSAELVRSNEFVKVYAVITGNSNPLRYLFYLKQPV